MKTEMTIAEIKAMYFDDTALMLSPYPLYRYHYKGDRFYYYTNPADREDGKVDAQDPLPVHFAVGVTTLTRKTLPQPEQLVKWIADMGYDAAIAYRDTRAKYGSLLHTILATLLIKRVCDLDTFAEVVANYCKANSITVNEGAWVDDLKQDALAFAAWTLEYNVRPLAIELSLVSPRLRVAGTLDLLCEMDYTEKGYFGEVYASGANKGQPKESKKTSRRLAIIDFKSGRNSHASTHNAAQLRLLEMLLKDNYPQYADTSLLLYNWHPKDWRTKPNYTLNDQTHSFTITAAMAIISLYSELYPDVEEKKTLEMFGVINLDAPEDERHNYSTPVIRDIVQTAINEGAYTQTEYDITDSYFDTDGDADLS